MPSTDVIARVLIRARRIFEDQRGTVFVEYSSLLLLVAIAALAILSDVAGSSPN
jgi:Flp pilus assembly pilin Flp